MNSRTFTRVTKSINFARTFKLLCALSFFISLPTAAQWTIDFSRRADQMGKTKMSGLETSTQEKDSGLFDKIFQSTIPMQEIVIINTEQGFIPSTVRVREGAQYRLVIVNVNEKAKNVSFVMDAFSEHHATFYGQLKSFYINPKKEGIYTFVSPETSAQGRLVVHPAMTPERDSNLSPSLDIRAPASE